MDRITYPDNSFYSFLYEATPSYPADVTGRVSSVTLPTGATISYTYYNTSNDFPGCTTGSYGIFSDGTASCLMRTIPDGTWTYTRTPGTNLAFATLITAPKLPYDSAANQTIAQFQGTQNPPCSPCLFETQRDVYQGPAPAFTSVPIPESTLQTSSLLQETQTCYNGAALPCTSTAITPPIARITQLVAIPSSAGKVCKHDYFFDSYGLPVEQDDYDYGNGAPATTPFRKLITVYNRSLTNNILDMPSSVTICNGTSTSSSCTGASGSSTGTPVAQTNYIYDEGTPSATSGVAQHTSVSGSRGNLTTINYPVSGLTAHFTYYDTGTIYTSQDVNGATTTFGYSSDDSCAFAFPDLINEPMSMSRRMNFDCGGGLLGQIVDENYATTTVVYHDPYFWRPASVYDPTNAVATFTYTGQTQAEVSKPFNSGNSTTDVLATSDSLGRPHLAQVRQGPGDGNYDSTETDYDALGRPSRSTVPYVGTAGQTDSSAPAITTKYDALNRPLTITDGGNGTVNYSYIQNDVFITLGPAPSGEHTKRRQLEYDAVGRLTSVCEITSASGSGACGQTLSRTGYWTKYTYDALGDLVNVTQNAQSGSYQTRNYTYDAMSRLTSETNPESGTKTYVYDTDSAMCGNGAYTSNGDLVKTVDAAGNCVMLYYDALHRVTDIGNSNQAFNGCKRFRYDNSSGYPGSTKPSGLSNTLGRLIEAATDACNGSNDAIITDEWFSYTARGEVSDVYQSTPNSGGYYHLTQTYWANGSPNVLSGLPGLPTITYSPDGEGRARTVGASSGQNPVTNAIYTWGNLAFQVTFGSGDSDNFSYDSNTFRMTQFKFNVGTQSQYLNGALTWNRNGSLRQLAITDQFNSANTQTCNYSHDDLRRIATANCGTAANQTFSYDPFGNISKSGSPYTFQPSYSASTNRMTSIAGFTPTYDNNGNVTNDSNHTYAWDADGNAVTVDGVGLTFDALDRMVEQNRSGAYTQIVYGPTGDKLALMNGQTLRNAFVPLPGQATAVYTASGLDHYRHADWLGSARLTSSSPLPAYISSLAYAPYGETYASSGSTDPSFTGMNSDTTPGDYDFLNRHYSIQGRWPTPDPAGLAAVDPTNPQSWNRYAYVLNNPLGDIDPLGLQDKISTGSCAVLTADNTVQVIDCPQNNLTAPYGGDYESYASLSNSLASDSSSGGSYCGGCYPNDGSDGVSSWSLAWQLDASTSYLGKELGGFCDATVCGLYSMVSHPINTLAGTAFLISALPGQFGGGDIGAQMQIYDAAWAWGNRLVSGDPTALGQALGTAASIAYAAENFRPRLYKSGGGGINLYNTPTRGSRIAADWGGAWKGGSGFHFDIAIKRIVDGWKIWEEASGPGSNWFLRHHWQPWK